MLGIKESIKEIFKNIISINSDKLSVDKFKKLYCTKYNLTSSTTISKGTNWSIEEYSVYMVGNVLQVYFNGTRSSNTGAGNISNETVLKFAVKHGGKVTTGLSVGELCRASSGHLSGLYYRYSSIDDNTLQVEVVLASTHVALTAVRGLALLPVRLNVAAY